MNQPFSKKEKSRLRELAGRVWEAELNRELGRLYGHFRAWKENGTNPFDLSDKIHQFHDGTARDLCKLYTRIDPWTAVAKGLECGLLPESAVDSVLLEKLAPFRRLLNVSYDDDEEDDSP